MVLRCLEGMVILYSFQTPKSYLKVGYFSFCCASKVKLQRCPHWLLCILFISITFLFTLHTWKGDVLSYKSAWKFLLSSYMTIRACRIYLVSVFHNWMQWLTLCGCSFHFWSNYSWKYSYTQIVSQLFLICLRKPVVFAEMSHLIICWSLCQY